MLALLCFLAAALWLVLSGGSMGATSALTFTALHPDLVDGVVAFNGHANHVEYTNFQEAIQLAFGGTKEAVPEEYKKRKCCKKDNSGRLCAIAGFFTALAPLEWQTGSFLDFAFTIKNKR